MLVIDEHGDLIEVEGDVVPEGCKLPVAALTMDAAEVAELRRRCAEAADEIEDDDDGDADGGDHEDEDEITPAARAYLHAKMQLDYRTKRKKVTAPAPSTPSWQRSPWRPRAADEMGGAPDSAPDAKDAA